MKLSYDGQKPGQTSTSDKYSHPENCRNVEVPLMRWTKAPKCPRNKMFLTFCNVLVTRGSFCFVSIRTKNFRKHSAIYQPCENQRLLLHRKRCTLDLQGPKNGVPERPAPLGATYHLSIYSPRNWED